MAGESSSSAAIAIGSALPLLVALIAFFALRRIRSRSNKSSPEGIRIVNPKATTWYDPRCQRAVPEQLGHGDIHAEEGLLSVFNKRTKSEECLVEPRHDDDISDNFSSSKFLSVSSLSLSSVGSENTPRRDSCSSSYTLRNSPYVEFNLLWATSTSCLSVYVIRITSLPPSYANATCSYRVTLHKPDKTTSSRSSNKVRRVNLNPDCLQVFSFQVPLDVVKGSKLELEVYARKSKHFLSKTLGHLHYQIPFNMRADSPMATSQPLVVGKKNGGSLPAESPKGSVLNPFVSHPWGEVQILAQYQVTGGWQGRVKIVVMKAQKSIIGKSGGSYKMELIIKKEEETESVHQTKFVNGPNPVWNTPFIFDVTQSKINDYRVEMNLIRTGRLKKTTLIGHSVLGLGTTPSGTKHWENLTASPNKEFTTWHPVTLPED